MTAQGKQFLRIGLALVFGIAILVLLSRHMRVSSGSEEMVSGTGLARVGSERAQAPEPAATPLKRIDIAAERRRPSISESSIRDGERLIEHPAADFFLAYQILTKSGVSADLAKSQLRPILGHLYYVASCNRFLSSHAETHAAQLDEVRQDVSRTLAERAMLMNGLAANQEAFRQNWVDRREKRLVEFSALVNGLGVAQPEDLFKQLLRVEPTSLPPDESP